MGMEWCWTGKLGRQGGPRGEGGTVEALGLGSGSELRILGMEGKCNIGPKGKFSQENELRPDDGVGD